MRQKGDTTFINFLRRNRRGWYEESEEGLKFNQEKFETDIKSVFLPRRCCQACRIEHQEDYPLLTFEHDLFCDANEKTINVKHICDKGIIFHKAQNKKDFIYKGLVKDTHGILQHVISPHLQEQLCTCVMYPKLKLITTTLMLKTTLQQFQVFFSKCLENKSTTKPYKKFKKLPTSTNSNIPCF